MGKVTQRKKSRYREDYSLGLVDQRAGESSAKLRQIADRRVQQKLHQYMRKELFGVRADTTDGQFEIAGESLHVNFSTLDRCKSFFMLEAKTFCWNTSGMPTLLIIARVWQGSSKLSSHTGLYNSFTMIRHVRYPDWLSSILLLHRALDQKNFANRESYVSLCQIDSQGGVRFRIIC